MSTYTARCHREGPWWVTHVVELDMTTQTRRLDQVDAAVRSLIGLFTEEDPAAAVVALDPTLPDAIITDIKEARRTRDEAEQLQRQASDLAVTAARELAAKGFTVRDIGALLGVSFQRAQQLVGRQAS